jgi:hypothetical protein
MCAKSQGLAIGLGSPTASKVLIDIGPKEMCAGLTFVALSRAKRIEDIAFSHPMFSWKRMSRFAEGKHLQTRKDFEARLDRAGERTAERYKYHWPYGDEANAPVAEAAPEGDTGDDSDVEADFLQHASDFFSQQRWLVAHEHNHLRTKLLGVDEEANTKTRSQQKTSRRVVVRNRFFERNKETVNISLPFPVAFGLPPAARNGYTMRMRIVDFIRHQDAKFETAA